jgi:hypothetical protein
LSGGDRPAVFSMLDTGSCRCQNQDYEDHDYILCTLRVFDVAVDGVVVFSKQAAGDFIAIADIVGRIKNQQERG